MRTTRPYYYKFIKSTSICELWKIQRCFFSLKSNFADVPPSNCTCLLAKPFSNLVAHISPQLMSLFNCSLEASLGVLILHVNRTLFFCAHRSMHSIYLQWKSKFPLHNSPNHNVPSWLCDVYSNVHEHQESLLSLSLYIYIYVCICICI